MTPFVESVNNFEIEKLAQIPRAQFEFWIQEKWSVLPTDPRFLDLTQEQLALLYAHYERINPPARSSAAMDPDYPGGDGHDDPNLNKQKFIDPEFDNEWESLSIPVEDSSAGDTWEEV